jgi:lipoprotein-releasing system permease protein
MMILYEKSKFKTLFNLGTEIKNLAKFFLLQGTLLSILVDNWIISLNYNCAIQQQFQLIMITESLAYPVVFALKTY